MHNSLIIDFFRDLRQEAAWWRIFAKLPAILTAVRAMSEEEYSDLLRYSAEELPEESTLLAIFKEMRPV